MIVVVTHALACSPGRVYKARQRASNAICVIKQILMAGLREKERGDAINEAEVLSQMDHPHIIRYIDSFYEKDMINIVMEYAEKGDLGQRIKARAGSPMDEEEIWHHLIQTCQGLVYLHDRRILHRDLKPQVGAACCEPEAIVGREGCGQQFCSLIPLLVSCGTTRGPRISFWTVPGT